jgi:voltage-gated potassium channel
MQVLGFVWLVLLILDFTRGLSPLLAGISTAIWVMFAIDFALRMILAPAKIQYLKHNWLVAISLVVPALRVFSVSARCEFSALPECCAGFDSCAS